MPGGRTWKKYNGATHLYVDADDRLWIKEQHKMCCVSLRTLSVLAAPDSLLHQPMEDFYVDSRHETWIVCGDSLISAGRALTVLMPEDLGRVQDIDEWQGRLYVFCSTGTVAVFDYSDGRLLYTKAAYGQDEMELYSRTSLIVKDSEHTFYQIRTHGKHSVLQAFDTKSRSWRRLLTSSDCLHTLIVTPNDVAYVTTPDGYISINLSTGEQHSYKDLRLTDGTLLDTGINTVCQDREGGIWLGTYDKGLLYLSPLSGLFDTRPIDVELTPILTDIFLNSESVQMGRAYDGRVLTSVSMPYVERLTLEHHQNAIAFQFSAMNNARPRSTCYRYRFSGDSDNEWHTATADAPDGRVDDKGLLYLAFVSLQPGKYTLEVMASTNASRWNEAYVKRIDLEILPPWWATTTAYLFYLLLLAAMIALAVYLYTRSMRRRLEQKSKEDLLLLRIKNLVEQVNQYENSVSVVLTETPNTPTAEAEEEVVASAPTAQELDFMSRATRLVEQHLADPQYSVEQLASDLCMERTGLYRKLTAMMDKSPVAFIRSIRLSRAAEMLLQRQLSVTEIAERTGFSTVNYFSKCFQKEYGCKPSEYAAKVT